MPLARDLKRRARAAVAPLVFLSLVGYFGWNATRGEHGLVAFAHRKTLLQQVKADREAAQREREAWIHRVAGLRTDHIEADTVDEQARAMLNLSDPTDLIVMYSEKNKLF